MFNFVFSKLLRKKWMVISLLIGNILMVAIAASGPLYSNAILWQTLTRNLSNYLIEENQYPGTMIVKSPNDHISRHNDTGKKVKEMVQELDVPVLHSVVHYFKINVETIPETIVEEKKEKVLFEIDSYSDIEEHIRIVNGEMYSREMKDHTIDVIVNERTFVQESLVLGEEFKLSDYKDTSGVPYRIRIAGIFENSDDQDLYWMSSPSEWFNTCLMDEDLFQKIFADPSQDDAYLRAEWYVVLDYTQIRGEQVQNIFKVLNNYKDIFQRNNFSDFTVYFYDTLKDFVPEAQKLNMTITVLQLPIFILLAVFIFMVSRQMLEMEQNEIAVYKSRGAGKRHILQIYLLQSTIIAVLGMICGIPLGILMCKVLGSSSSFLEFVQRSAMPVEMKLSAWLAAGIAIVFSIGTMVLPAVRYANVNIVMHKRKKNRINKRPWWKMVFLDVILLGISLYGFYQYNQQRDYDPLLYLCSTLFMIGAGLFIFRIFPWIIRLVFQIGKRWWSPSAYASFLRVLRTESNQGFIMVFLILTVAMGIFNAQMARTINIDEEERIRYTTGADIVVQEVWESNAQEVDADDTGSLELIYEEPSFEKYWEIEGLDSATRVLVDEKASVSVTGGTIQNALLMGIHTKEFGETAWFKDSLMSVHWYEYLNAMSQNSQAILVSSNFQENYGYEIGDIITYSNQSGESAKGVIYGFVDYWPSYEPVVWKKDSDGVYKETEHYLIVAHLAQLQYCWGVTPYQVWIKNESSSQYLYNYAEETGMKYLVFEDVDALVIKAKNQPVFQGTNGVLTVGFICILLLCIIGFLIYWILSIQSRTLQFGIFRAMGMSMKEVLMMLINEQIFVTGISIVSGILVGRIASKLFVPLIRIGYSSSDQVIPLEVVSAGSDYMRVLIIIGLAIMLYMAILGGLISKIKISQALKLGED